MFVLCVVLVEACATCSDEPYLLPFICGIVLNHMDDLTLTFILTTAESLFSFYGLLLGFCAVWYVYSDVSKKPYAFHGLN
jgi:hypothetical protein